ncbi:MAG: UDP-glucose 6-dehydrogenase [Bacteroidota bacterium]|jgi:UDPglucose 6-dehydrogenase
MKIAVIGTGYVGLVTGTCFAETGNNVVCIDINENKIQSLNNNKLPIYEPGLEDMFLRNKKEERISFTTNLKEGIKDAEIIFLALPTPSGEDGSADLQYVIKVAKDIGPLLEKYTIIVDKSTVPVGTSELVKNEIAKTAKTDFTVVSNPEFLREGVAVEDFMKPERVVIGTESERAREIMNRLYAPLVRQGNPIIFMDERSAEMTKYAANAFLAMKITFMNEIANLSELVGANVDEIRKGIGSDSRIGKRFLFSGVGYGGSCFPKDVKALSKTAKDFHYDFKILESVMQVNEEQKIKLIQPLKNYFSNNIKGKKIAIWGLAFKPYTDDIREAPALYNIKALLDFGCKIAVYDPEAMENVKEIFGEQIEYCKSPYQAVEDADALVILTEWPQFRTPDFEKISNSLKNKVIFDGRNLYELKFMEELGFTYISIGRKKIN